APTPDPADADLTTSPYTTLFRSQGGQAVEVHIRPLAAPGQAVVQAQAGQQLAAGDQQRLARGGIEGLELDAAGLGGQAGRAHQGDRKSTRLNSSHVKISYAGFCL